MILFVGPIPREFENLHKLQERVTVDVDKMCYLIGFRNIGILAQGTSRCQDKLDVVLCNIARTVAATGWVCGPPANPLLSVVSTEMLGEFNLSYNSSSAAEGYCRWVGITCDKYNQVIALDLSSLDLDRPPLGINFLTGLTNINLAYNAIAGSLPSSWSQLTSLRSLEVQYNLITGTLPSWLYNMSSLEDIKMSYNSLTGSLSSQWGQMSNLRWLDLSQNNFEGSIPSSFGNLKSLQRLYLFNNYLSGNIPSSMSRLKNSLVVMSLKGNELSGKISADLCPLSDVAIDTTKNQYLTCFETCWSGSRGARRSDMSICAPSSQPSSFPSSRPSQQPTSSPTVQPSSYPSSKPSQQPILRPTVQPSSFPSSKPSHQPILRPTVQPSSSPSSRPTALTMVPTIVPTAVAQFSAINQISTGVDQLIVISVSTVVGFFVLLVIGYFMRRKVHIAATLRSLPVHELLRRKGKQNIDTEKLILGRVHRYPETLNKGDHEGKTAVDLAMDPKYAVSSEVLKQIIQHLLPVDLATNKPVDPSVHIYAWCKLLRGGQYSEVVESIMNSNESIQTQLVLTLDEDGHPARSIAHPNNRAILRKYLFFYHRYEIKGLEDALLKGQDKASPVYESPTCIVYEAIDTANDNMKVALKLIKQLEFSEQEVIARALLKTSSVARRRAKADTFQQLDHDISYYCIDILRMHPDSSRDANDANRFLAEIERLKLRGYSSCVVMPFADVSLRHALATENISFKTKPQEVRRIITDIAEDLQFIAEHGLMHGDIKPNNIVRQDNRYKLIDFDASAKIDGGYAGLKYSTAYAPPELLYEKASGNGNGNAVVLVKSIGNNTSDDNAAASAYELLPANSSFDVWSLGMLAYTLCSGFPLLVADGATDSLDQDGLMQLLDWSNDFLQRKLSSIKDIHARNFISQLLMKDPQKRPPMNKVLQHPFITGGREEPEYDVYVSYREESDGEHAQLIYDRLTSMGVKVYDLKSQTQTR